MKLLLATPLRPKPADPHFKWLEALASLGHETELFNLSSFPAIKIITTWALWSARKRFRPDLILFSAGRDAVFPIKDTIFFTGVAPETLSVSERQIGIRSRLVVVNEPGDVDAWKQLGARHALCLPISAVDPEDFKIKSFKQRYPVSFVGTLFTSRQEFLAGLIKHGVTVKVWGWLPSGTKILPELQPVYGGEAWGKRVARIYQQSRIGLNLAPEHLPLGGNLRAFEIAAGGALLLSDRLNQDWFAPGKEAIKFHAISDCVQKINYYLSHQAELKTIAICGRRRALSEHTYRQRFRKLMKYIASL
jgi:hypothetical protein